MTTTSSGADRPPGTVVLLLAAASLAAGVVTVLAPHLLTGPPAMNGSAKGTALVISLAGVPTLVISHRRARCGSLGALTVAAGAAAYLTYNGVLLVLATPFNRAFLLYEAMLALGLWSVTAMSLELWRRSDRTVRTSSRWPAGFILGVVALNLVAWMADLVPALLSGHPRSMLAGTGLTTNPVYVQDLAFWLPAFAWVAVGMWRGHGPRTALAAAVLAYWVLESFGVAVDQWWGHRADPASAVVSPAAVPLFLVMGALTLWPLVTVLRSLASSVGSPDPGARTGSVLRSVRG